ncbi:hypothetical protein CYK37_15320 [Mesorhizobium loti]|nr:S-layer family protein [Mesorhizobium loti]PLP58278.1 hypothetical protein CYK37_15320 [Mesorhizobium loti]
MGSGERTSFRIQSGVRGSGRAGARCLPHIYLPSAYSQYTRQLLKTSALSTLALATLALALAGTTAAQADPDALWQPQVRAIIGADNRGASTALEGFIPLKQTAESVLFLDVRGKHRFDDGFGQDVGIGVRRLVNPDLLVGGYAYANVQTIDGHTFSGATLGIEAITANYDGHLNVYVPFGGDGNDTKGNSSLSLVGNQLLEQVSILDRRSYSAWGIEGEFGVQVPLDLPDNHSLRLDVGGYHFADPDGRDGSVTGAKAGIEYAIRDAFSSGWDLTLAGEVRSDNRDHTQFAGSIQLSVPFNPPARNASQEEIATAYPVSEGLRKRVNDRVRGDIGVRVNTQETTTTSTRNAINAATGAEFGTFFFADGENTLGLGTQGDPTTLDDAVAKAGKKGFVVALGGKGNILTAGALLAQDQTVIGGAGTVRVLNFFGSTESFNFGGSNGTLAGTNPGKAVLSLAGGNTISGITVTGGGIGISGFNIKDATLTDVTVTGTGSHGVAFTGSSTGVTGTNLTSSNNGGDGLHIESDGTFNFTGTTLLSGNAGDGLDIKGKGTYAFATLNAQNNTGDGIHVSGTSSTGKFSTKGGTVSGNGGTGVFIDPITADVMLDQVSQNGGTAGIVLDQMSGSFTVKGKTSIVGIAGAGISISNAPAAIRFGDVEISAPGGAGISLAGVNAAVVAGNIVISGLGLGATGLDFSGSQTMFTAQSASISGGAIGIDLTGTLAGSKITITDGGTIVNGGTGVRLGIAGSLAGTANADFSFGGGTIGGSLASLDARGLNPGAGTYAFGTTAFTGAQLFDIRNLMFVGATATGKGDGSSINDLATIVQADASTANDITFILVNRGTAIDATSGFTLGTGQILGSFGNGRSFSLGGVPLNVTGTNVQNGVAITDAGGAATLTSTAGSSTVAMASSSSLLDVNLTNAKVGGGTVVVATGVSNIVLTGVAISGGTAGFLGTDLNGAALTNVSATGATQDGFALDGTSTNVTGTNLTSTGNGNAGLLVASDGFFSFTGTTLLSGNAALGLGINGDGDYRFETLNVLNNAGGGIGVISPGAGRFSTTAGTISGNSSGPAALGSILLGGVDLNVTLTSLTQNGGGVGAIIAGSTGSFTVTGATTVSNVAGGGILMVDGNANIRFGGPVTVADSAAGGILVDRYAGTVSFDGSVTVTNTLAGPGIEVTDTTGAVTFNGSVTVNNAGSFGLALGDNSGAVRFGDVSIDQPGVDGITVKGTNGTISFGNVDITGLCNCAIGLDLSSSTSTFTATTFDVTGTPGAGSTGIDLSGTIGGSVTIGSGVITDVDTGIQLGSNGLAGAQANTTFNFGAAGGGSVTGVVASLDTRGLLASSGSYEFNTTFFNGPQLFDPINLIYVGSAATGAGDGSSVNDLADINFADTITVANAIFALVNDGATINDTTGFTLADGQTLASFGNGRFFNTSGAPINVTHGANIIRGGIQNDPTNNGAATLTNSGGGNTLTLANGNLVADLIINSSGVAIDGSGGITGFISSGVTIQGATTALFLNNTLGTVTVNNLTIQGPALTGIVLANTSATFNFTGTTTIAGGSNAALLANNFDGTADFADIDITGGPFGIAILNGSSGTLTFGAGSSIANASNAAFSVGSSNATVTYNGTITQNNAANAVRIANNTGGTVTFGGAITANTTTATAISIANNTGGIFNFAEQVNANITTGTGVLLDTNTGAAINFTGGLDITTTGGDGFTAINNGPGTYGGIVTVTGSGNTIASGGNGLLMGGMEVGAGGIAFDSISAKSNAAGAGIALSFANLLGDVNIGGLTDTGYIGGVFGGLTGAGKVNLTGTIDLDLTDPFSIGFAFGGQIGTVNIANVAGSTLTIDGAWRGIEFSGALGGTANIGGNGISSTITAAQATGAAIVLTSNTIGAPVLNYNGALNVSAGNVVSVSGADLAVLNLAGTVTSTTSATAFDFAVARGSYNISSSITHTGGAGVNVTAGVLATGNITFSGTSKTFSTGASTAVSMAGFGTLAFTNGGLGITTGSGTGLSASAGTINVAGATGNSINSTAGTAVSLSNVIANVAFNSIAAAGGTTGVGLSNVSGSFSVSGATQLSGATGAAVNIKGSNGTISFADLDIALSVANSTGFDASGATVNADITAGDFDLTSSNSSGTTAVDLAGTIGSGTIRLGDANATGASSTIGGTGTGPAIGFKFSATTDVGFIYGDGENGADKASTVKAADIFFAPGNAFPTSGSYNFLDVDGAAGGFIGDTSEATGPTTYYVSPAGTGTGTADNPGSIAGAEASGAKVIVLVDTTLNGASDLIDMLVQSSTNNTLNLANSQILIGLAAGQSVDTAPLGAIGGILGTPPFQFSGINSSTIITAAGNVDTVLPTLTTNTGNTVEFGASGVGAIQNVRIDNTGAGYAILGTNVADIIIRGGTIGTPASDSFIKGGSAGGLMLSDGAANSKIALSNLTLSASGGGVATVDGSVGAGTMTVRTLENLTLNHLGETGGLGIFGVTFDADPSTPVVDTVNGGTLIAGTQAAPLAAYGAWFDGYVGKIAFTNTTAASITGSNAPLSAQLGAATQSSAALLVAPIAGAGSEIDFGTATLFANGTGLTPAWKAAFYSQIGSGNRAGFSGNVNIVTTNAASGLLSEAGGTLFLGTANNTITASGAPALALSNNTRIENGSGGSAHFGAITANGGLNGIYINTIASSPTIVFDSTVDIANTTLNAIQLDSAGSVSFNGAVTVATATVGGVKWTAANATDTLTFAGNLSIANSNGVGFFAANGVVNVANGGQITTLSNTALRLSGVSVGASGIKFTGVTVTGASSGIDIANVSTAAGGTIDLGTVSLTGITSRGVDVTGTLGAALNFGSLNIGLAVNAIGLDLNGATISANITANDFDVNGGGNAGTLGIDMTGTTGAGVIQLGDLTNSNPGGQTSTILNVARGVLFSAATNANLVFGDGQAPAESRIETFGNGRVIDSGGALPAAGSYDFDDVNFVGDTSNLSPISLYYVDPDGDGDGSFANPGSIGGAEGSTANVIVLIDPTADANTVINMMLAAHQGVDANPNSLNLRDGQVLISFGSDSATSIDVANLGIDAGTGAPGSFSFSTVQNSTVINRPAGLQARPTLTTTAAAGTVLLPTVSLGGRITSGIDGVLMSNTGTGDGVLWGSNQLATFTIRNSSIAASGNGAIDIFTTAGAVADALILSIDGNTLRGGSATPTVAFEGQSLSATSSSVAIRSFTNNVVVGGTGASGIRFANIHFDGSDAAGNQPVSGGTLTVGTTGARVTGDGINFLNPIGTLNFTTLNVANNSGTGILVDTKAAGTTFSLNNSDGVVDTVGGAAFNLDPLTVNMTFASVTANGGTNGVIFDQVAGIFRVLGATTITGTTGFGVNAINTNTGVFNFNTLTIDNDAAGNGGGLNVASGTFNITGLADIDTTTGAGVSQSGGTIGFNGGLTIDTTTGTGVAGTGGILSVAGAGTRTVNSTGGTAVSLNAITIGVDGFNFGTTTSGGGTNNISLTNVTGTFNLGTGSLSGATTASVNINGGSANLTYSGNVSHTAAGALVNIGNAHSGSVTFNTGTLSAANGTGLQFDNADGIYNFNGTTTLNGGDAGIDIITGSDGAFTFGSGTTITSPSGAGFLVSGGSGNITYSGTISKNNTGRMIDIQSRTGGTITFSGSLSSTTGVTTGIYAAGNTGGTFTFSNGSKALSAGGTGVDLQSNTGATFNFTSGGLAITTTTGTGFNATGGGTVTVEGSNNTISSTTGTALNVANTTIGAAGMTFRSISSNGGSSTGIILNTTGSTGGLHVTGTGTVGSGGTIANKTGADGSTSTGIGIYLNNTMDVQLANMQLNDFQNFAIRGFGVNGFTMNGVTINGTNGSTTAATAVDDAGEGAVFFGNASTDGLSGAVNIINSTIGGGAARNLSMIDTSNTGGVLHVTLDNVNFGLTQALLGGSASVILEARNAGTTSHATVTDSTFAGAAGDLLNFTGQTGTTMDVIVGGAGHGNTFSNTHSATIGGGGMTLASQGVMRFDVQNNTFSGANGSAINMFKASAGTSYQGTFSNNVIGTNGVAGSGSATANGIFLSAAGAGTITLAINNNIIQNVNGNAGIFMDNTGGSYTVNATITNNILRQFGTGAFAGIALTNGANTSGDTVNVFAKISSNTINGPYPAGYFGDIVLGASGAVGGHSFTLSGATVPDVASESAIQNFLAATNTTTFGNAVYSDNPFVPNVSFTASAGLPPLPTPPTP